MTQEQRWLGIDFGTTNSCMAAFNPSTGMVQVVRNSEGEEKTPSVVVFEPDRETVGKLAWQLIQRDELVGVPFVAPKREIASGGAIPLGDRLLTAHDAVVAILTKLKTDAEEGLFHGPVTRVVLCHPVAFDAVQRERLRAAAMAAGFEEVELIAEPVAAAIAHREFASEANGASLVYDLGGGTCDVALVEFSDDGRPAAVEHRGANIGGEDFDLAVYERVVTEWDRDGEELELPLLAECRRYKEDLSVYPNPPAIRCDSGGGSARGCQIQRQQFEKLIANLVDGTMDLLAAVIRQAKERGVTPSEIVLVGGSTRVPLVEARVREVSGLEPRSWHYRDVAVAVGAAVYGRFVWGSEERPAETPFSTRSTALYPSLDGVAVFKPQFGGRFVDGLAAYKIGDWDQAEKLFREALESDPDNAHGRFALACALLQQGRRKKARKFLRALVAAHPKSLGPRLWLAAAMQLGASEVTLKGAGAEQLTVALELVQSQIDTCDAMRDLAATLAAVLVRHGACVNDTDLVLRQTKWLLELGASSTLSTDKELLGLLGAPELVHQNPCVAAAFECMVMLVASDRTEGDDAQEILRLATGPHVGPTLVDLFRNRWPERSEHRERLTRLAVGATAQALEQRQTALSLMWIQLLGEKEPDGSHDLLCANSVIAQCRDDQVRAGLAHTFSHEPVTGLVANAVEFTNLGLFSMPRPCFHVALRWSGQVVNLAMMSNGYWRPWDRYETPLWWHREAEVLSDGCEVTVAFEPSSNDTVLEALRGQSKIDVSTLLVDDPAGLVAFLSRHIPEHGPVRFTEIPGWTCNGIKLEDATDRTGNRWRAVVLLFLISDQPAVAIVRRPRGLATGEAFESPVWWPDRAFVGAIAMCDKERQLYVSPQFRKG